MKHPDISILYGPPGTGKTHSLLEIVEKELASGVRPDRIAVLAFTKQAAGEFMQRACERFSYQESDLPYIRTIHSMTFRQLGLKPGDVMQWKHYQELGSQVGLNLKPKRAMNDDWYGMDTGDRIMFLEGLARVKRMPLYDVWQAANEIDIPFLNLEHFARCYAAYKAKHGLLDYTDMLDRFVKSSFTAPKIDVLVVDEGQDLSLAQWIAIQHAATHAKRVYVAGDDLQAIYTWSGADVDTFLALEGRKRVLEQSYRIPALVHQVATGISSKVRQKSEQVYRPRAEQGVVRRYPDPAAVDMSKETGSWYLLARNGYMLRDIEQMCMSHGYSFTSVDKSPIDGPALKAILSWERMRKGQAISKADATTVLKFVSTARIAQKDRAAVAKLSDVATVTLATPQSPPWFEALDQMSAPDREYFRAARRRGETLTGTPRIRVSTIHASKGGQADNIMLLTDISQRTDYEAQRNPDAEHRTFYVGVTRAKQGLHIIQPQTGTSYNL